MYFFHDSKIMNYKRVTLIELGILLSHTVVFVLATLLSKLLYAKSSDEDPSSSARDTQVGLPYHVNYMVDPDLYYVPIFGHVALCVVFYTILMITFDVLYMTLVQHCCGLFTALRSDESDKLYVH